MMEAGGDFPPSLNTVRITITRVQSRCHHLLVRDEETERSLKTDCPL